MNQSVFVLGALVSAMVFSFAQQQTIVDAELRRVDEFHESRSSREATHVLDRLESLPFDPAGAVEEADSLSLTTSTNELSGLADLESLNDISEFTDYPLRTPDSLDLHLTAELRFVEPAGDGTFEVSQQPSFYKEVTIAVEPETSNGYDGATLSRVFSFAPRP